jgi:hypothetical protein
MSYDAAKSTVFEREMPVTAINSELTEDQKKKVAASQLGFFGSASALARFTEDTGRVSTKNISIIVPQGTAAAFISLGPWEFHFGPRGFLRERPLGELLISFGITGFTGRQLDVDVTTRLTDINADDPWEADVRINALCFA